MQPLNLRMPAPKPIAYYVKPTLACNHCCDYCYMNGATKCKQTMTQEDIRRILENMVAYCTCNDARESRRINIIWHGGEPLLIGMEGFKRIVDMEKRLGGDRITWHNFVQTNASLIDYEWIRFFKDNRFSVGVSIDGPEHIHNKYRKNKNKTAFTDVIAGINLLLSHKYPYLGALSVVSDYSVNHPNEILSFFNCLGIAEVDFLPCISPGMEPPVAKWADFMIEAYKFSKKARFQIVFIRDLLKIIKHYDEPKSGGRTKISVLCELSGQCGKTLSITPDGSIYPCECLVMDKYCIGNVYNSSISDIINSDKFNSICRTTRSHDSECETCKYHIYCRGGCFRRRIDRNGDCNGRDKYCAARKKIIDYVVRDYKGLN